MKDFLGKELSVGDLVVFTAPGYRMFSQGKIKSFTPKKVRIEYVNTWNFTKPGVREEYLCEPDFLIMYQKFEYPNE